jgi:mutator family transposase
VTRPQLSNLRKIKYFFTLLLQKTIFAIFAVDETMLCRIATDLTLKGLSMNQLLEHLRLIYGLKITKEGLKVIRKNAAKKAEVINRCLDREIAGKIKICEADEAFQGKHNMVLAAAEKFSQYLLGLQHSHKRDIGAITAFLTPIGRRFQNIRVVITDLLKSYQKAIKNSFKRAVQLGCHVHARRHVMRLLDKINIAYKRQKKRFINATIAVTKMKAKIKKLADKLKEVRNLVKNDEIKLKALHSKKKESKTGRTKTIDKQISAAKKRLIKRNENLIGLKDVLGKCRIRRYRAGKEARNAEQQMTKKHIEHTQSARLAGTFYRLLNDQSPEFEKHRQQFQNRLNCTKYPFATKLTKLMKDNPHLFSFQKPGTLTPNFQNSNTIERIFGILRPLLNSTRHISSPEGTNEYCVLFRLYYNSMPRFTGINNDRSPFEQLGGILKGKTYLDLLFPLKGRTACFVASKEKLKTKMGFYVRGVLRQGVICLS